MDFKKELENKKPYEKIYTHFFKIGTNAPMYKLSTWKDNKDIVWHLCDSRLWSNDNHEPTQDYNEALLQFQMLKSRYLIEITEHESPILN